MLQYYQYLKASLSWEKRARRKMDKPRFIWKIGTRTEIALWCCLCQNFNVNNYKANSPVLSAVGTRESIEAENVKYFVVFVNDSLEMCHAILH